jgi:hypothetical protein
MALTVVEVHRRTDEKKLNEEWILLHNTGDAPQSTRGCRVLHYKPGAKKGIEAAKLDPGFTLAPDEKLRLVVGNPGTKAHGAAPQEEGVENYYLFMKVPLLKGNSGTIKLQKGQFAVLEVPYGE